MQKTSTREEITEDNLSLNTGVPTYTLLFDGDRLPLTADALQVINVETAKEAADYLRLLGNSCELHISEEYRSAHFDIEATIRTLCSTNHIDEPPFDTETAAALIRKLPLDLKSLIKSNLRLKDGDKLPPLIKKELVHKTSNANVLISEPFSTGWLHYFNMFQETTELTFDHPSEHVQGLLISEALRQVGIACAHLQGLSPEGKLVLLNYNTNFYRFIERNEPILLRAYTGFSENESSEDKNASFYIQVLQWGRVCADSVITTFACLRIERQKQLNKRLEKIESRNKSHFESKVNKVLELESASRCV